MSGKIRSHLRGNVVGYVALFLVISGGTAYATHPGGADTIDSADIINNSVKAADVRNDLLSGGGLVAADLRPDSVGTSEVDGSLTNADIADTNSLGTAEINESSLFNDNSLDTSDINEGSLNVVEGPANMQMLFGREQLSGAESGPSSVIFASGRANVNAEKNGSNQCSLTFLNSPVGGTSLKFVREVVNGATVATTEGTLASAATDSTPFSVNPVQVRWQAWAPGDANASGRVITVQAAADATGTTCDFSAVMTIGA